MAANGNGPNKAIPIGMGLVIGILTLGVAGVAILSQSSNAQVLLLQEQQRIEKETRANSFFALESRLERIEGRSVFGLDALDIKLQQEIRLLNDTIEQEIIALDESLQREIAVTDLANEDLKFFEHNARVQIADFEARFRVLEARWEDLVRSGVP